jgi:hypothetical protein
MDNPVAHPTHIPKFEGEGMLPWFVVAPWSFDARRQKVSHPISHSIDRRLIDWYSVSVHAIYGPDVVWKPLVVN